MKKCAHADRYKAVRPPKCNGGIGCDYCEEQWRHARQADEKVLADAKAITVAGRLAALAALKDNRGAVYGDEYKRFGRLMMAIFPDGLHLETEEEFNRYGMYVFLAAKLSRYGANIKRGGHADSLDDLSVYAQMMRECDEEFKK